MGVLAIFTAGAGNALKWIGRLSKAAPRLAAVLRRALARVDSALPPNFRHRGRGRSDRGDRHPDTNDSSAMDKQKALIMAKAITEAHDARDSPLSVLRASLLVVKQQFRVVDRFDIIPKGGGHYRVMMIASEHEVDDDYTPRVGVNRGSSFLFNAIERKYGETMSGEGMREIQMTIDRIKNRSPRYNNDGTEFLNSHLISPNYQRLNTGSTYTEWTVKTPSVGGRAKRRIVVDRKTGKAYYTHDHYESFIEIDISQWK